MRATRSAIFIAIALLGPAGAALEARAGGPPRSPLKPADSALPFIISYWCGPPKSETTRERYLEIAGAGFNVAFPAIDLAGSLPKEADEHNRKYLDLCQQAGLKAIVHDDGLPKGRGWSKPVPAEIPDLERALDAIVAKYSSHPAFLSYFITDEPGIDLFPRVGAINQHLLKRDPRHVPFINLLPNYAEQDGKRWSLPNYEGTLARYLEEVKPALVCWDHYRQLMGEGDESHYWYNLETVRKLCAPAGVPYVQIIVSLKHMGYRESSEADLRWQVYTSLAYGSRGILYFTYWDVKGLAWADAPAIMTMDGKRDKKYEFVKKINHRIAKLGPTLVKLVSTGAYCNEPRPPGGVAPAADSPVRKMEGGPVLVGCFQNAAGHRYIFPVNRSFKSDVTASLTLDEWTESVSEISQETGEPLKPAPLPGGVLQLKLPPGDGKLFLLNDKK